MTCRCSSNALRLFVRTVAQVDISAGSSSFRSLPQRSQAANRTFSRHRTLPSQRRTNSTLTPQSTLAKCIAGGASNNTISSGPTSTEPIESKEFTEFDKESTYEPTDPPSTNDEPMSAIEATLAEHLQLDGLPEIASESPHPNDGPQSATGLISVEVEQADSSGFHSAFVDFSPEAINAMAAEVAAAKPIPEPPSISEKEQFTTPERRQGDDEKELASSLRALGVSSGKKGPPKSSFKISYSSSLEPVPPPADDWVPPKKEPWQVQKAKLKEKFPEGWNPLKKLSPDAMVGIRQLHAQMPEKYTTGFLADHFKVSPDSIRRILKSKWQPDAETQIRKDMRWFRRGERVWSRYAELGVKPPRRWRDEGIGRGKPEWKKKAPQQPSRVVPALLTTTRRDGGFFGNNGTSSNTRTGTIPELVTTRRPDH